MEGKKLKKGRKKHRKQLTMTEKGASGGGAENSGGIAHEELREKIRRREREREIKGKE